MVIYWWEVFLGWVLFMIGGAYLFWLWVRNSPLLPPPNKPDFLVGDYAGQPELLAFRPRPVPSDMPETARADSIPRSSGDEAANR